MGSMDNQPLNVKSICRIKKKGLAGLNGSMLV